MVKKIVLIYFQSALIAVQEEIPINICTVSKNKQEELIAKWQLWQSQFRHTQKKTGIALCLWPRPKDVGFYNITKIIV